MRAGRSLSAPSGAGRRAGLTPPTPAAVDPRNAKRQPLPHTHVTQAIEAYARGEIVVVTDDDDRENEGDLVVAASLCTPEKMAFIIRNTCGIVCAPLTRGRGAPLAARPDGVLERRPAWHSLHRDGRRQAWAHHRHLGRTALQHGACARQRQYGRGPTSSVPGHVFPLIAKDGGVLMRSGHTEAAVDLCKLAGAAAGRCDLRTRQ